MDPKQFRQWEPPTSLGTKVISESVVIKAVNMHSFFKAEAAKEESKFEWDPRREQFRAKKVLEMERAGKEVPAPKPKKASKPKSSPRHVLIVSKDDKGSVGSEEPKKVGRQDDEKFAQAGRGDPRPRKNQPKKLTGGREPSASKIKKVSIKVEPSVSVAPREAPSSKPSMPRPIPSPKSPTPKGDVSSMIPKMTSTGGPQLSDARKGFSNLDELKAMAKARFKAGTKPVGAETPAAAGAATTPGVALAPTKMSTLSPPEASSRSSTGGGQTAWQAKKTPGISSAPTASSTMGKQYAWSAGKPGGAAPAVSSAAPAKAASPQAAPAASAQATPVVSSRSTGQVEGAKPKMLPTGAPQPSGKLAPIGSAAGIGYAEGSFIGAETGASKTGGTALPNVAATEAVGMLSGAGGGGAKPSRQTFTPSGYMPTRSPFTGRGGMGGGTALQSAPGQKPTQSALKSFIDTPMGIPGIRRLPPG